MTKARTNADNASADIQGVTAGTGLSGGGTSGTVTLTNDMATTIAAKGDLVVGTGNDTYAALTVGSNGDTLVADSSTTTGLRWQGNFVAGKNKIINGDCFWNQRATTSSTTSGAFLVDRFKMIRDGNATTTGSVQQFTPGTAPVAGYEAKQFIRLATTGQTLASTFSFIQQTIEDVRTFAGQTITISFWAKAASGTPKIAIELEQYFGTGGSPSASVFNYVGQVTLSTSWTRHSITFAVPSISGKTIGTNENTSALALDLWTSAGSDFNARTGSLGIQTATIDIWGVQVEAGSVATPFTTATGTLAGEFQACARYYYRTAGQGNYAPTGISGVGQSTTTANGFFLNPVAMRTNATAIEFSNIAFYDGTNVTALTNMTLDDAGITSQRVGMNAAAGLTQYRPGFAIRNNNAAGYVAFSAEL